MLPSGVQPLLAEWNRGDISRGELCARLIRALTPTTVDEVMTMLSSAVSRDVFDDLVKEGRTMLRRGERSFAIGSVPTAPPDEAIVAFDDWYRRTFRREARGPVNAEFDRLLGELHCLVAARRVTAAAYTDAMQTALRLIPADAPDREALLAELRWYEPWIDWTEVGRPPPGPSRPGD